MYKKCAPKPNVNLIENHNWNCTLSTWNSKKITKRANFHKTWTCCPLPRPSLVDSALLDWQKFATPCISSASLRRFLLECRSQRLAIYFCSDSSWMSFFYGRGLLISRDSPISGGFE